MNRFIRWYNQNRKSIWATIAIIVIIIGVIQLINYFYKVRNEEELSNLGNQIQNTTINYNYNNVRIDDNRSGLTGEVISENQETEIGVIDDFINYCNENNLQSAYDLLTDECKEEMYPTLEDFQESYYNQVFTLLRNYCSIICKPNICLCINSKSTDVGLLAVFLIFAAFV